jgi:hypothetical protein
MEVSSCWGSYPLSLPSDVCDPYTFDLAHYARLLDDNSERLFVADTQLRIKVIEVGEQGRWSVTCSLEHVAKFSSRPAVQQFFGPGRVSGLISI